MIAQRILCLRSILLKQTSPSQALHILYSLVQLICLRFARLSPRDRTPETRGGHTPILQFKLRATHLPAALLLLKLPIEKFDDGGSMKGLRPAGVVALLSLIIAPAANTAV